MTVSMRVMSAGDGYKYLLRTVAAGDGDRSLSTPLTRYYAEAGTPPGRWLGSGVTALGHGELAPGAQVSEAQLQLLVGMGRDPVTGVPLGRAHPVYSSTAERVADRAAQLDPSLRRERFVAQIEVEEAARGSRCLLRLVPPAVCPVLSRADRLVCSRHLNRRRDSFVALVTLAGASMSFRVAGPQPSMARYSCNAASPSGRGVKCAHLPRISLSTSPASTSFFRWCDSVGWVTPNTSGIWHAHTLEHRLAAMWCKIRNRTGSASALTTSATRSACSTEIVPPPGAQASAAAIGASSSSVMQSCYPLILTLVDTYGKLTHIDGHQYVMAVFHPSRRFLMPVIRVFEPALCCNTGVCGPDLDQELVDFTAAVNALKAQGVDIHRANLASEPAQFAEHPVVVKFLQAAGSEGLPLTLVDDVTVLAGRHARRDELERYAGLNPTKDDQPQGGCCGPQQGAPATSTGCC